MVATGDSFLYNEEVFKICGIVIYKMMYNIYQGEIIIW